MGPQKKNIKFTEVSFRIWLRLQLFKRCLIFYKNGKQYREKNKILSSSWKKFNVIKNIYEKIRFEKPLETDHCIYLTVLFVLKIKSRRHFKTFKINYKNEFFFSNNLI